MPNLSPSNQKFRKLIIGNSLLPLVGYGLGMICLYLSVMFEVNTYDISFVHYFLVAIVAAYAFIFWQIFKRAHYSQRFSGQILALEVCLWFVIFAVWDLFLGAIRPVALILCFFAFNFVVMYATFKYAVLLSLLIATIHMVNSYLGVYWLKQNDVIVSEWIYSSMFLVTSVLIAYHATKVSSKIKRLAATDPLTKLNNRRYFMKQLTIEFERCRRYAYSSCIVLIDLDNFKKVNDDYGHEAGDKTLCLMAECLMKNCRTSDSCARWGGEEFIMMLSHTDEQGALVVAERLLAEFSSEMPEGYDFKCTFSAGIANLSKADSLDGALREVDLQLYKAKDAGRNQVSCGSS